MSELAIKARILSEEALLLETDRELFGSEQRFELREAALPVEHELLARLAALPELVELVVRKAELRVKKTGPTPWRELAPQIGKILREVVARGPLTLPPPTASASAIQTHPVELPAELQGIQQVLAQNILPALAQHGGSVQIVGFQRGVLDVVFSGGCQGCGQSTVTVKQGIEKLLKQTYPQILQVRDLTDHDKGENPYYR